MLSTKMPAHGLAASVLLLLLLLVSCSNAQNDTEKEIHPWLYCNEAITQPCALGYFCTGDIGEIEGSLCQVCPALEVSCDTLEDVVSMGIDQCNMYCRFGTDGDACNESDLCDPGHSYCDYRNGDNGICRTCTGQQTDCLSEDLMVEGQEDCLMSCDLNCYTIDFTSAFVNGREIASTPMIGAPGLSVSGPIVDCTNLIYEEETVCRGAKGAVCLIHDELNDILNFEMVLKAQSKENGCIGAIIFGDYPNLNDRDTPFNGHLSFIDTIIPSISISYNDGIHIISNDLGSQMNFSVDNVGDYCWKDMTCSDDIPCIGRNEGMRCAYDFGYHGGWCWPCPTDEETGEPDPFSCFFDYSGSKSKVQPEVEACAATCAASLDFATCKFCPEDVSSLDFGVENKNDQCEFCPEHDVKYPDREVPFFGGGVMCWQMQSFFSRIEIPKDSQNCQLAQMMNYICGCEGPGYGGASTIAKRKVLVWLPRVMAFLSLLGSSFIIFDAARTQEKRETTFHQLMIILSIFDIFGSLGYLFTSLPIPVEDYIYGSYGNDKSCVAQGVFIQLGTISCYTNVSLALYFWFVTTMGWNELQIKRIRVLLFGVPLLVGFIFTFAGIPYFDNMILWCNNTAKWWPDIPLAIAIVAATCLMVSICVHVYFTERASDRWRGRRESRRSRRSLANQVFWQSFWYIIAFYITWVPYLALQYTWATGKAFSSYGFILFAGTMVPLQGAWNCFVYIRPRYLTTLSASLTRQSSIVASTMLPKVWKRDSSGSQGASNSKTPSFGNESSSQAQETAIIGKGLSETTQDPSSLGGSAPFRKSSDQTHDTVDPFPSGLTAIPEPPEPGEPIAED